MGNNKSELGSDKLQLGSDKHWFDTSSSSCPSTAYKNVNTEYNDIITGT